MDARFLIRNACNLVFRQRFDFEFDCIPLSSDRITFRKATNLVRISGNRLLHITPALGYPYMAQVAPTGVCDLRCERCPIALQNPSQKTFMPLRTFEKFIDEVGDYLLYMIMWSWGEPLLNPDVYSMFRYARDHQVLTVTSSNLHSFSEEEAEEMVASGLDALIIALDGATPATHERLRLGGEYQRVLEHTRMIVEEKARRKSDTPLLNLRMVVSRENESEVDAFRTLARELGVDMVSFKAYSTRQSGFADPEWDEQRAPQEDALRWYEYTEDFKVKARPARRYDCRFMWTKPMLFADGRIASCEYDFDCSHELGNINEQSFDEIWFGERAKDLRKCFSHDGKRPSFCADCVYDYSVIDGCVLDYEYLSDATRLGVSSYDRR